ncbi:MAG: hypothetical protein ABII00_07015 [Elusimicrobiota bacterium]
MKTILSFALASLLPLTQSWATNVPASAGKSTTPVLGVSGDYKGDTEKAIAGLEDAAAASQEAASGGAMEDSHQRASEPFEGESGRSAPAVNAKRSGKKAVARLDRAFPGEKGSSPARRSPSLTANIPGVGNSAIVEDKAVDDGSEKKKKAATNLKRTGLGGAWGAVGLGLLGFFIAGPIGALIGAAIGFAVFAGLTHIANNGL